MNQVMPICSVVMIIHDVLLDCVMNYFRGVNMNQVMSMSIVVMIIHVVMNFRGVNMNQVMPMSIVVMIIHVVLLDCVMNIFQRSEYEPSDLQRPLWS